MDPVKTGAVIRSFRTKLNLTQKELAERIHVSDKAVSKWERGNGCPDVSLLSALAEVFGTDIQVLLTGERNRNESEKGDMKKLKFYVCGECGNIITASSEAAITCCGNRLSALQMQKASEEQKLCIEDMETEWYITAEHPMTKEHFISFAAYVNDASVMLFRQYPEWNFQVTLPKFRFGRLVWYCSKCGLLYQDLRPQRK